MNQRRLVRIGLFVAIAGVGWAVSGAFASTTLTVSTPTAGQACTAGSTVAITWQATEPNGYVDIELLRNGVSFTSIGYVPMADGQMDWEICSIIGDAADNVVHIVGYDASGNMVQADSGAFSITGSLVQPTVAVTWPTAGTIWPVGVRNNITWTSTNPAGCVYVDLYKGDQLFHEIGYAPMDGGTFGWTPCTAIGDGTDYAIRISMDGCGASPTATSEAFSITGSSLPSLVLTHPTAGEAWVAGTAGPIQWTSTAMGAASIVLLKNGQWSEYVGVVALGPGGFAWPVACDAPTGTDYVLHAAACDSCGRVVPAMGPTFSIRQRADFDWDGDADLADFGFFSACFSGPNRLPPDVSICTMTDFDGDGDVDLADFGVFRAAFNGTNRLPRCD